MQWRNTADRYGDAAKLFHWLTVAAVVLGWSLGQFGDVLPRGAARATGLFIHISAGLTIVLALVARLAWRMANPAPPHIVGPFGRTGEVAPTLGHVALYGLLVVVPVAGIVVQFGRGNPLPIFGLTEIASPWPADRAFARSAKEVHGWLANTLVILALLHAGAALAHHFIFRDRTLRRMLPGGTG
ncbi:MAG: cytochrome [Xanthobacteraceae bacterium]|nr:cytochrome [Xanthobacteraceae bacterium]